MKIKEGLVVFITGGASGLGLATVRSLHSQGASVAVADLNTEQLQAIHSELQVRIFCITCDVTKEEEVKTAIDKTVQKFGTIHVAVPSAGVSWGSLTLTDKYTLDVELYKRLMEINVYGGVYVAKYASIVMSKNKPLNEQGEKGLILFVSSIAAEEAQRGQIAYGASKGAINGMLMPMARDLGKYGIRVAAIAPGPFDTPLGMKNGVLSPQLKTIMK